MIGCFFPGTVKKYHSRVHSVDELNQHLLYVWHGMEQSVIDNGETSSSILCVDNLNKCYNYSVIYVDMVL